MWEQLDAFMQAFTVSSHVPTHELSKKAAQARARNKVNPMLGMDALWTKLDKRHCVQLPKGNRQQDVEYVRQIVVKYGLDTCYILSADPAFHQQVMGIDEALQEIVGSAGITIISFIPGRLAYFEGHSTGDRWLCHKVSRLQNP